MRYAALALLVNLAACSAVPPPAPDPVDAAAPRLALADRTRANDLVLYSFGLMDVGYRFGGRNPDAGLDCSGMVSYIVEQVTGLRLPHNAGDIARLTRPVERSALQPGDLVFFNTLGRPFSHVGIYVGDGRFVHAPSRQGRIRVDSLRQAYYADRFEAARSLFVD